MVRAKTNIGICDILICAIAVVTAFVILVYPSASISDTVSVKAENLNTVYDLSVDRTVEIVSHGHVLTLEIKDGAARISDSSCPDKICVSAGWINDQSRPIVCAPAEVVVRIENGGGESDADFIAGR